MNKGKLHLDVISIDKESREYDEIVVGVEEYEGEERHFMFCVPLFEDNNIQFTLTLKDIEEILDWGAKELIRVEEQ